MTDKAATTIPLTGRIDSNNAARVEADVLARLEDRKDAALTLDAQKLEYISSAGLRGLLCPRDFPGKSTGVGCQAFSEH